MISDSVVEKIENVVNSSSNFMEYKRKMDVHEPKLMRWINESAQKIASEEGLRIMQLTQENGRPEDIYNNIVQFMKTRMVNCLIAGFISGEVNNAIDWESEIGIQGRTVAQKKLKALLDGKLEDHYYDELVPGDPLSDTALRNFRERKKREEMIEKLATQERERNGR